MLSQEATGIQTTYKKNRHLVLTEAPGCTLVAFFLTRPFLVGHITGLLRYEAEMTLLQPHLGDSRLQEFRSSLFGLLLCSSLTLSWTEKSSSLKKAPLKSPKVLDPIKISPFVVPTLRKEAPTESAPMGSTPHKAVTNHFLQVGGKSNNRGSRGRF